MPRRVPTSGYMMEDDAFAAIRVWSAVKRSRCVSSCKISVPIDTLSAGEPIPRGQSAYTELRYVNDAREEPAIIADAPSESQNKDAIR